MKTFMQTLLVAVAVGAVSTAAMAENTVGVPSGPNASTGMSSDTQANTEMTAPSATGNTAASGMDTGTRAGVSANTSASVDAQQLSSNQVQDVQQSLKDQGFTVAVDGVWGPNTQAALREFQQANSLDASGTLDQSTMTALNVTIQ